MRIVLLIWFFLKYRRWRSRNSFLLPLPPNIIPLLVKIFIIVRFRALSKHHYLHAFLSVTPHYLPYSISFLYIRISILWQVRRISNKL